MIESLVSMVIIIAMVLFVWLEDRPGRIDWRRKARAERLAELERWYEATYHPKFQIPCGHGYKIIERDLTGGEHADIDRALQARYDGDHAFGHPHSAGHHSGDPRHRREAVMAAIENKTIETAYATKVDDLGRPNIVVPIEVPAAEVAAMQVRADANIQKNYGGTNPTMSGSVITRAKA